MKKMMIITSLMLASIIVSNACIDDFNNEYNDAEEEYSVALKFCNMNFIFVPTTDDFCREMAYMEYSSNVDDAISTFEDCLN